MPIANFVKQDIVTASPEQTLSEVASLMKNYDIGAVVIVDDEGAPTGIVTDRDIVLRCVCEGDDPNEVKVESIMSSGIETVSEDAGVMDILECMKSSKVRRVPIVDRLGKAVALVSFGDIFELLTKELSMLAAPTIPEEKKIDKEAA